jgi:phage-related protein
MANYVSWRFGSGSRIYLFPHTVHAVDDNFADLVPRTNRMPGVDGGFDNYGNGRAPKEIGSVRMSFLVESDWARRTYSESDPIAAMILARDAINEMLDWGKLKLFRPMGETERFCNARVDSINMPESHERNTHLWLPVSIIFQVNNPFWFQIGTEAPHWSEVQWSQFQWGGTAEAVECSGTSTSWTVTTLGNATTHPRITIMGTGAGASNPTLQRLVGGVVVDEVSYTGSLADGDRLEINCRAHTVTLNSVKAYTTAFDYETSAWMELRPGANSLRLLMGDAGDSADVYVRYYEAYQ